MNVEGSTSETEELPKETPATAGATPKSFALSQKEYRPTPYRASVWEVVGEVCPERNFVAMELAVIRDARMESDPMFETFDGDSSSVGADGDTFLYGIDEAERSREGVDSTKGEAELAALKAEYEQRAQQLAQESYERGKSEAEAVAKKEIEAIQARLDAFVKQLGQDWSALGEKLEKQAVELSLRVAQKILRSTAELKPDYILEVVREALKHMGAAKPLTIRVSPDDYEFLEVVGIPMDISPQEIGVTYQIDEALKAGCVIETDFGEVDFDLDRMWEQVKESLWEVYK